MQGRRILGIFFFTMVSQFTCLSRWEK